MNKMEAVMKLYKKHFPDVELEKAGTWIRVYPGNGVTPSTVYRTSELLEKIYYKIGTMYEYDPESKVMLVDTSYSDPNSFRSTGESWNTQGSIHVTEPASERRILESYEEEEGLFDDIGEL